MANLCCYDLYATGTKENLGKFARMMEWKAKPSIHSSMYESDMFSEPMEEVPEGYRQHFSAATRWSVEHGMMSKEDDDECVTLQTAAKMLGLSMEIWSEESGCCFSEHITIRDDGGYDIECEDYYEAYTDDLLYWLEEEGRSHEDGPTFEEFREYLDHVGIPEPDDIDGAYRAFLRDGRVEIGGFADRHDFPL